MEPPRSAQQRKSDTLSRLAADIDAWIATGDTAGDGYLVPLSFLWDGTGMIVSTPRASVTARNLSRRGRVRVGLGELRDVTIIDGTIGPGRVRRRCSRSSCRRRYSGSTGSRIRWMRLLSTCRSRPGACDRPTACP